MTAAPKAISHGLGAAAGAAFGAFAGISAANAGAATENANAGPTDNTTFFIESAPLIRSARRRRSPSTHGFGVCYLKFRPLALPPGKAKTTASAAFLGVLPVCLQKDVGCCVNVTKQACLSSTWHAKGGGFPHSARASIDRTGRSEAGSARPQPPFSG